MNSNSFFAACAVIARLAAGFGKSCAACLLTILLLPERAQGQGIPEPDLIVYGVIKNVQDNANLRLGHGPLTCVLQPVGGGSPITVSTTLTNINDQFSYVLRIPCETLAVGYPLSSNVVPLTSTPMAYIRAQMTWYGTNQLTFVVPSQTNTTISAADRGRLERVDLTVAVPVVIGPNGLPVDWQLLYFGQTGIDPNLDSDGDGLTDGDEYRTGTNPRDALSGLRFVEVRSITNGIQLKWRGVSDRAYALQRASSPGGSFLDIQTGIGGTPPFNTFVDTNTAGGGPFYYRLRIDDAWSVATGNALRLTGIRRELAGGLRIDWLSAPNQTYTVQRSSNLSTGFISIMTNLPANPPTNSFHDPNATGFGPYFYRLKLEP